MRGIGGRRRGECRGARRGAHGEVKHVCERAEGRSMANATGLQVRVQHEVQRGSAPVVQWAHLISFMLV